MVSGSKTTYSGKINVRSSIFLQTMHSCGKRCNLAALSNTSVMADPRMHLAHALWVLFHLLPASICGNGNYHVHVTFSVGGCAIHELPLGASAHVFPTKLAMEDLISRS